MKNSSKETKVFIPNEGPHDYSVAMKYGKLIPLTSGSIQFNKTGYLYRKMFSILKSSSENDYILISGPALANVIACCIFMGFHGKINLLIYKRGNTYLERTIKF